jgi:hypothetical protein
MSRPAAMVPSNSPERIETTYGLEPTIDSAASVEDSSARVPVARIVAKFFMVLEGEEEGERKLTRVRVGELWNEDLHLSPHPTEGGVESQESENGRGVR